MLMGYSRIGTELGVSSEDPKGGKLYESQETSVR